MKYFKFIGNLDVASALAEVTENENMFGPHTPKPEQSYPLREGRSIHLRHHDYMKTLNELFPGLSPLELREKIKDLATLMGAKEMADKMLESADSPTFSLFPECRKLIETAMTMTPAGSVLGRCYIAKMVPGGNIYPHIDPGKYFEIHDRYHIVLKTNPGVSFSCGNNDISDDVETVRFEAGELWVFNNKVTHWASNKGETDRIHIIMDVSNGTLHY